MAVAVAVVVVVVGLITCTTRLWVHNKRTTCRRGLATLVVVQGQEVWEVGQEVWEVGQDWEVEGQVVEGQEEVVGCRSWASHSCQGPS